MISITLTTNELCHRGNWSCPAEVNEEARAEVDSQGEEARAEVDSQVPTEMDSQVIHDHRMLQKLPLLSCIFCSNFP